MAIEMNKMNLFGSSKVESNKPLLLSGSWVDDYMAHCDRLKQIIYKNKLSKSEDVYGLLKSGKLNAEDQKYLIEHTYTGQRFIGKPLTKKKSEIRYKKNWAKLAYTPDNAKEIIPSTRDLVTYTKMKSSNVFYYKTSLCGNNFNNFNGSNLRGYMRLCADNSYISNDTISQQDDVFMFLHLYNIQLAKSGVVLYWHNCEMFYDKEKDCIRIFKRNRDDCDPAGSFSSMIKYAYVITNLRKMMQIEECPNVCFDASDFFHELNKELCNGQGPKCLQMDESVLEWIEEGRKELKAELVEDISTFASLRQVRFNNRLQ